MDALTRLSKLLVQRLSYAKEQSDATIRLDGNQKENLKEQRKKQRAIARGMHQGLHDKSKLTGLQAKRSGQDLEMARMQQLSSVLANAGLFEGSGNEEKHVLFLQISTRTGLRPRQQRPCPVESLRYCILVQAHLPIILHLLESRHNKQYMSDL